MDTKFFHTPFAHILQNIQEQDSRSKNVAPKAHTSARKGKKSPKNLISSINSPPQEITDAELFLANIQNISHKKTQEQGVYMLSDFFPHNNTQSMTTASKKKKKKNLLTSSSSATTPHESFQEMHEQITTEHEPCEFMQAMRGVSPLMHKGRDIAPVVEAPLKATQTTNIFHAALEGTMEFSLALKGEYLEGHVVGLDANIMHALRSGMYSPEAHIDLHGLNALQAYHALVGFFRSAWYKSLRTVLVVPGRGKNSLNGFGVLRDKLQYWLTQEPFKRVVLAFCTARPIDGGPGSIYILLRKYSKKKGKIAWDRLPSDPDLF